LSDLTLKYSVMVVKLKIVPHIRCY